MSLSDSMFELADAGEVARPPRENVYSAVVAKLVKEWRANPEAFRPRRGFFPDEDAAKAAARLMGFAARENGATMRRRIIPAGDDGVKLVFTFAPRIERKPAK